MYVCGLGSQLWLETLRRKSWGKNDLEESSKSRDRLTGLECNITA